MGTLNGCVGVDNNVAFANNILDIGGGLDNVALDIHSETGSLWDCKTEIKSDHARNTTETDENAPHEIDVLGMGGISIMQNCAFIGGSDDQGNKGGGYRTSRSVKWDPE